MLDRRVTLAVLLAAGIPGACSAASSNPLIGEWLVEPGGNADADGFNPCKVVPRMIFTRTTQTMFTANGAGSPQKVIYLVAGKKIYVSSTPGFVGAPMYVMLGPDEVTQDSVGACKYHRQ